MQHLPDIILLQISNYEMPLSHLASGIEILVHPAAISCNLECQLLRSGGNVRILNPANVLRLELRQIPLRQMLQVLGFATCSTDTPISTFEILVIIHSLLIP